MMMDVVLLIYTFYLARHIYSFCHASPDLSKQILLCLGRSEHLSARKCIYTHNGCFTLAMIKDKVNKSQLISKLSVFFCLL